METIIHWLVLYLFFVPLMITVCTALVILTIKLIAQAIKDLRRDKYD